MLADPLKRAIYDVHTGIQPASAEMVGTSVPQRQLWIVHTVAVCCFLFASQRRKINKMKRAQAEREISCMEGTVELNRQGQEERNGTST